MIKHFLCLFFGNFLFVPSYVCFRGLPKKRVRVIEGVSSVVT